VNEAQFEQRLAQAHRDLHADEQALLDERAAGRNAFVMAAAAHAYCAVAAGDKRGKIDTHERARTHDALLAAHRATTPSQTPPTHVIVAMDELERLRAGSERVRELCREAQDGDIYGDYDVPISEVLEALDRAR
jgi:hypothetical protein